MREIIWKIFDILNKIVPKSKKVILLYSGVEYKDNIKALGDYLFEHNYEKKYKIYLGEYQRTHKKIKIFNKTHRIYNKLCSIFIFLRAKYVFYAFNTLPIYPAKHQIVFQMWHGMPLKTIFNYGKEKNNQIKYDYFSFILATSPFFKTIMSEAVPCNINKVIVCGQPKTDGLFKETNIIKKNNCKLIFWAPTFRQAKYWDQQDAKLESILPLISDNDLEALNEYLKNNNVIIVSKLHPMENCDEDLCIEYSNLFIYSHRSFNKRDLDLYPVLGQTDALITDYSSVYMDYLLLDKPMAFVIDNISEYSENRGFIFKNPQKYMTGPCLKNKDELYEFIRGIADGSDFNEYNRTEANELFNDYEKTESNCKALLKLLGIE